MGGCFLGEGVGEVGTVGPAVPLASKQPQKPYRIGSLGPKVLNYESFEGKG